MTELVLDRKVLLKNLENDAEFLKTLIGIFMTDWPGMLADMRSAVTARNSSQVISASHALRGSVSIFGAQSAVEAVRTLEYMGQQDKFGEIDQALCAVEREMALVLLALEEIAKETA